MAPLIRLGSLALLLLGGPALAGDWTSWRGPGQDGVSDETGIVAEPTPAGATLTLELPGRGTPAIHGTRAYVWGYEGEGEALAEVLVAMDTTTGEVIWRLPFRDHISDIIYNRYSIGAPSVDPATGRIYLQTSPGVLMAVSPEGEVLWTRSMMDGLGRLTFPNGRTGAPIVVEDKVIVHGIVSNWGKLGPARDRFFAFDKATGELIWISTPGTRPRDSSHSTPVVADVGGRRVLYAGTGCGNVVAVDARTGEPVWRTRISEGGINVSLSLQGDTLVATHAKENLDSSRIGRMVALDVTGPVSPPDDGGTPLLDAERWRNDLTAFSSSPVILGDTVYQVTMTGELEAVDLATGAVRWHLKLGPDQLHASPLAADGRLYIPLRDGSLHVVTPGEDGPVSHHRVQLEGSALGAPAVAHGQLFVHTTERLYVWGERTERPTPAGLPEPPPPTDPVALRVRPADMLLRPGGSQPLTVERLDAAGLVVDAVSPDAVERFIPPTAKVRSEMDATWDAEAGALVAPEDAGLSAGAWKVAAEGMSATTRGRTVAGVPFRIDFEDVALDETTSDGTAFAYPPLAWIGARLKWEVREVDGRKALAKTLDRMLFQRSTVFMGHPDESGYTITADVMTDGDRRLRSAVGVVNQRYRIVLKGNQRRLEISSNQERLKEGVRFDMEPGVWYRLKSAVQVRPDGTAVVQAKAWPAAEDEPAEWTLVVEHADGHTHGSPGLFGFSPQNLHRVYIDAVEITPTAPEESP